jgi:hypothetical protein
MTKGEERLHPVSEVKAKEIDHPAHYTHGIEAIEFIDSHELNFSLGNAIKYIVRAGRKPNEKPQEALKKAVWYLEHEVERLDVLEDHGLLIVPA